ncbi:hypothetical protein GCM10010388_27040 [Streptomyces mauvecolor]
MKSPGPRPNPRAPQSIRAPARAYDIHTARIQPRAYKTPPLPTPESDVFRHLRGTCADEPSA